MLQSNENIFEILSESVSEAVIVVDEHQKIIAANSSAEEMFGYEKGELLDHSLNVLIPKNYHAHHGDHFKGFLDQKEKRQMGRGREIFGLHKCGKTFPVEAGLSPFNLYEKNYVMALVTDISTRIEIEKSQRIQSQALKSALNGIIICDALQEHHPIIFYNEAFVKITGYSKEEILGKNCRFLQNDDRDQEGITVMRKAIKEGKSCQVEIRNYRKDGTQWWNETSITPVRDKNGNVTHLVGIQNDITERKKAAQEQEHWAKIFDESLNEIYIFHDQGLRFIDANLGAQRNIGYTMEELKTITPVDIKPEFTEAQFRKTIQPLLEGKTEKLDFETTHQRKDGSTYPVEVHLQLSTIEDKKVFVAIILDITDRKNYTEKLERTVQKRTEQLREALTKEKELGELKTKFLSLVSHEFKTPLSGILTSTTLLGKYTKSEQQEKREKHLTTIKSKVKYLDNILNDFLSVERLENGKVNYKFSVFPLSKVINEVIYDANMILKDGQKINYPKDIDDYMIEFDEKVLELTLTNLINNAIKYSPENTFIDLEIKVEKNTLTCKITDEGIGIPEKEQKHVFQRYFRAANALLDHGTGIGLNIVKSHLENLGGTITFTSTENKGTTFIIEIPAMSIN